MTTLPQTIYGLKDPTSGLYRYVGRTSDPSRRESEYLRCIAGKICMPLRAWLLELEASGLSPQFEILESTNNLSAEDRWITKLRSQRHPLLNVGWTAERKARHSAAMKAGRALQQRKLSSGSTGTKNYKSAEHLQSWYRGLTAEERKKFAEKRAEAIRDGIESKRRRAAKRASDLGWGEVS